jgi:hypothetical protein
MILSLRINSGFVAPKLAFTKPAAPLLGRPVLVYPPRGLVWKLKSHSKIDPEGLESVMQVCSDSLPVHLSYSAECVPLHKYFKTSDYASRDTVWTVLGSKLRR